jgi:hypothetical protein
LLLSRCGVDFICIPSKLFLLLFYVNHQHITAGFFSLMCVQVFLFSFVVVVSGQKFNVFSCPLSHTIRFNTNQMNTIIYMKMNQKNWSRPWTLLYQHWGHFSWFRWCRNRNITYSNVNLLLFYFLIIWHFKSSRTFFSFSSIKFMFHHLKREKKFKQ